MEILTGSQEKLATFNLSSLQKTIDRTAYPPAERRRILTSRDQMLQGSNPFANTNLRSCHFYYPFILATPEEFEVHYQDYASGIILLPQDRPSYIRAVFDDLRRRFVHPNEIEMKLEELVNRYPTALDNGKISVVNPVTLEKAAITNLNADFLPPSGIMVAQNHDPLQQRIEMGYAGTGALFEMLSWYDPSKDKSNNVLSGLVTERFT